MQSRIQQSDSVAPADVKTDLEVREPLTAEARAIWDRSREDARRRFLAAAEKARIEGMSLQKQLAPNEAPAKPPLESQSERKQKCYCCGHANPGAAWQCEKCYVRL